MTEQLSARQELLFFSDAYRVAKEQEKEAKALMDELKPAIMALISEVVREEVPLARKTINLHNIALQNFDGDIEIWRQKMWPLWNIVGMEADPVNDRTIVTLEENDAFVKYEFVTPDGYKFGRTLSTPQPTIDVDDLHHSEIGEELIEHGVLKERLVLELDDKAASKYMAQNPNSKKVFEKYTVKGKPQIRLLPFTAQEED